MFLFQAPYLTWGEGSHIQRLPLLLAGGALVGILRWGLICI